MTNGDINRLGESIYKNKGQISDDELNLLQKFRISFSEPLAKTFNELRSLTDNVQRDGIVAFRLKRISTIINKVERQPQMKLSRMWDIAGIRCIFNSEKEVYKALSLIRSKYKISGRVRDYIQKPKPLGYKGIHVYIIDDLTNRRIEVQLRTLDHHNWATLIEITDLLYDLRLKELGEKSDKKFARFHALMSSEKELTKNEADLIYEVLNKSDFISNLSQTFRKNNYHVKQKWANVDRNHSFFLIEASKKNIPELQSFETFQQAEQAYFSRYKENENAEIVLTSVRKPDFQKISVAYANYILSYHTFINDIKPILQELALEALEYKQIFKFKKIFKTYEDLQTNLLLDVLLESSDLLFRVEKNMIYIETEKLTKTKQKKLENQVEAKVRRIRANHTEYMESLELYIPKNIFFKHYISDFLNHHNKRINKNLNKKLEFDYRK